MRLIDADNLLSIMQKACERENGYGTPLAMMHWFMNIITGQPTVDAVPVVHGEWIKGDSGEWQCSECREENCYAYDENLKKFTDLYCPNCGVKMDGKKVQE